MKTADIYAENTALKTADIYAENTALKTDVQSLKSQLQLAEARLALLSQKKFHKKSEKHNDWPALPFEFNEAELIADAAKTEEDDETTIAEHKRKKRKPRTETLTPEHLPRVDVHHHPLVKDCPCCQSPMQETKPEIQEQLACLPSQFYVVRNHYHKRTCACKEQAPSPLNDHLESCQKVAFIPLLSQRGSNRSTITRCHCIGWNAWVKQQV